MQVEGQTATFSPYSRYGIGELLFNGFSWQRSMGGIATGIQQASHLNVGNPASYAADSVTIFEIGVHGEAVNIANSNTSQNRLNGNISYLAMGFPLIKNQWYLTLGLLPLSASGYNIKQTIGSDPGNAQYFYQGDGGFNRYFLGTGFKITKNLSAGINAGYLYGTTNRSNRVEFGESNYLNTRVTNSITISDVFIDAGFTFSKELKNGRTLTIGIAGSPEQALNARRDQLWINYFLRNNGVELLRDTVAFTEKEKGNIVMPLTFSAGFSFSQDEKWLIGFDARYHQWDKMEIYGENSGLNNSIRIASGGQYTPDSKSLKYFSRVTYRIGGFYSSPDLADLTSSLGALFLLGKASEETALDIKATDIDEKGITLGFGLPLRGKPYFSHIDLAFELSERGTTENNLVRERYARVMLGLTLREDWFRKPKFD